MNARIVVFPETRVAAVEHFGPPELEHETARKLIAWKLGHRLLDPSRYRSYGIHYTDPHTTASSAHHVDFCLSFDAEVGPNPFGVINKVIPRCRCAIATDVGSRYNNRAAAWLCREWLRRSGEKPGDFPIFFHYVNVGPHLREEEMITDVYLPLR
jgi:AraC family transcriptional regulator